MIREAIRDGKMSRINQQINSMEDLFEHPDLIPEKVQAIIDSRNFEICGYKELTRIINELEPLGYTFNFGLDAEPYELKKV